MTRSRVAAFLLFSLAIASLAFAWFLWTTGRQPAVPEVSVGWSSDSLQIEEGVSLVDLTLVLSGPASDDVVVMLELAGTVPPARYSVPATSVVIAQGEVTAALPLHLENPLVRGLRGGEITVSIAEATNALVGDPSTLTVTIGRQQAAPQRPTTSTTARDAVPLPVAPSSTSVPPDTRGEALGPLETSLVAEGSTGSERTVQIGPFAAEPGSLLLLMVANATGEGTAPAPTIAQGVLNWDLVETTSRNEGPRRLSIYRAASGAGGSQQIEIEFEQPQGIIGWLVVQVENAPSGANGAAAVVQSASGQAGGLELAGSVDLEPLESDGNITVGAFFTGANEARGSDAFETIGTSGRQKRLLIAIVGDDPLLRTAEWPNRSHWLGVGVEITNRP